MPDIVLATLNAQYIHASFGLRCLMANLGELRERACLAEFVIKQHPLEIVEAILEHEPRIAGFGVYVWNVEQTTAVVALLKRLRPELIVILGGPEVSHETEGQTIVELADHVITGEADLAFAEVCRQLLTRGSPRRPRRGSTTPHTGQFHTPDGRVEDAPHYQPGPRRLPKIIPTGLPPLDALASPYEFYTAEDLAQRVVYVEASRGCPFGCEFCLSSLDTQVRAFPLDAFLTSMQRLLDRGLRQFKFVDRTFNLNLPTCTRILEFFLSRWREGLFLHFEMVPDRLPGELRALIQQFPAGSLQFEAGIQTFDEATLHRISRHQNLERVEDNLRFLREQTGVHIHADLIAGLPGEGLESFGRGFDRLVRLRPQEIQLGILKRLRGAPIAQHDEEFRMIYAPNPPYEILSTRDVGFRDMQRIRRFARYWDIVANSGNFRSTLQLLWQNTPSPFHQFLRFSDWLYARLRRSHGIALHVIARSLFDFLTGEQGIAPETAATTLEADWYRTPSREALNLRGKTASSGATKSGSSGATRRQAKHGPHSNG